MNQQFGMQQNQKKPAKPYINNNILESIRSLGSGVGRTVAKDVVARSAQDAISSLFGTLPKQGEIRPMEQNNRNERQPFQTAPRPEFVNRQPVIRSEEHDIKNKIDAVRKELAQVSKSLNNLNSEVKKAVDEAPVNPGIYHVNFFERLRSFLVILRQQVDDSRNWLSLSTGRKQKQGYWGRYKKHGTKFGLSSERTMATQAG